MFLVIMYSISNPYSQTVKMCVALKKAAESHDEIKGGGQEMAVVGK